MARSGTLCVSALLAALAVAACGDSGRQALAPDAAANNELAAQLTRNERNTAYLARVQREIGPHVSPATGTVDVREAAALRGEARQLAALAREHAAEISTSRLPAPGGPAQAAAAGASGCFYWGCRIAVPHRVWEGVKDACSPGRGGIGCKNAMKTFITSLGLTGWSATVAPWIVPAYWFVMDWACRVSGHRGFYINVTWALVTVISPM